MLLRNIPVVCSAAAVVLLAGFVLASPAPQPQDDRELRTREYVQSLVMELNQWTKDFPQRFYMAATRPPVDASKLSDSVKAGADDLGQSVKRLSSLTNAKDVLTNAEFRAELDKTIAAANQVNQALGSQRFPDLLQTRWDEMRNDLNGLAEIYKLTTLAYIAPPTVRRGDGSAKPPVPGALVGYITDNSCALKGKGMWTNASCVEKCLRDGDKLILVTEEGKVYQIANPDKVTSDLYGQKVSISGKTEKETITIDTLQ